ncbi:hypothetical protein BN2476_280002 [Paraburkholderia piptadeniae]|uniref:Uncharacterized protein n=1 Tax=Paraburkholderia piptadeniae TaxID=1701573 RepID=A0A1N7S1I1_9BURK|nr:hypothetical protein BN2476_280002 [Paraburkholderia piptadeniae]
MPIKNIQIDHRYTFYRAFVGRSPPTPADQENTGPIFLHAIEISSFLHFYVSRYTDETFIIRLPKKSSVINTGSSIKPPSIE